MIINVGDVFIKKLYNEDNLLNFYKTLTNNINKYNMLNIEDNLLNFYKILANNIYKYNMLNIEDYFKLSRKYFYRNKKMNILYY